MSLERRDDNNTVAWNVALSQWRDRPVRKEESPEAGVLAGAYATHPEAFAMGPPTPRPVPAEGLDQPAAEGGVGSLIFRRWCLTRLDRFRPGR